MPKLLRRLGQLFGQLIGYEYECWVLAMRAPKRGQVARQMSDLHRIADEQQCAIKYRLAFDGQSFPLWASENDILDVPKNLNLPNL